MDDSELEIFGLLFVLNKASYNSCKQLFIYTSGCYMVNNRLHALHKTIGMPIVSIIKKEPYTDS